MIKNILCPIFLLRGFKPNIKSQEKSLLNVNRQYFGPKRQTKEQGAGGIMIKNDNLKFETENYQLYYYPFHPQVIKKSATLYEINKFSTVLAFNFVPKNSNVSQSSDGSRNNWDNRKSISFKFNEVAKILEVNANEEKKWVVQTVRNWKDKKTSKSLIFNNSKKSQKYQIIVEETNETGKIDWRIETKMSHAEFELLQYLLKESLYDISGMKLMFDLRRNEQLAKMGEKDKALVDKEQLFRDYDNKDNLI